MNTKEIFKALDNDIRMQIMEWLKEPKKHFDEHAYTAPEANGFKGGVCVGSICEKAGTAQSTISHYLDILQRAELVESVRMGKWTYYRRREDTIQAFAQYIKNDL